MIIDDECHFFLHCQIYQNIRTQVLNHFGVWAHKTSPTLSLLPRKKNEQLSICVVGVSILSLYLLFYCLYFGSPIRRGFAPGFVNYNKGCTRLAAVSDNVYQLLAHGRWFSPGTPASSTTKTGRHDIAEILLKVALNTINQINRIKSRSWNCSDNVVIFVFDFKIYADIYKVKSYFEYINTI